VKGKLISGIEIWTRNRQAKEEHKQEMLKNINKKNQPKRNFSLNPIKLNDVLEDLNIQYF
jgi:hypothetical protein